MKNNQPRTLAFHVNGNEVKIKVGHPFNLVSYGYTNGIEITQPLLDKILDELIMQANDGEMVFGNIGKIKNTLIVIDTKNPCLHVDTKDKYSVMPNFLLGKGGNNIKAFAEAVAVKYINVYVDGTDIRELKAKKDEIRLAEEVKAEADKKEAEAAEAEAKHNEVRAKFPPEQNKVALQSTVIAGVVNGLLNPVSTNAYNSGLRDGANNGVTTAVTIVAQWLAATHEIEMTPELLMAELDAFAVKVVDQQQPE